MAKISARGATELVKLAATKPYTGGDIGRYLFVLCSDGRLLYRVRGDGSSYSGSGYSVLGKLKLDRLTQVGAREWLTTYLTKRGYTIA